MQHSFNRTTDRDDECQEIQRLYREIQESDRKLVQQMMSQSSKQREILRPIYKEISSQSQRQNRFSPDSRLATSQGYHENSNAIYSPRPNGGLAYTHRERVLQSLARIQQQSFSTSDEMKYVLKKIFLFYVSFGDRLNSSHLKANKLYKMMHDAFLIDENITKKRLDLMFCKYSKTRPSIEFVEFLQIVIEISSLKYPKFSPKDSFLEVFHSHFKPLYTNLYKETDLGELDVLFKEPLDSDILSTLESIKDVLKKLHKVYFQDEYQKLTSKEYKNRCEQAVLTFLKDFDICPTLLSCSVGFSLMHEILDTSYDDLTHNPIRSLLLNEDYGHEFTFHRFIIYMARLSLVCFPKVAPLSAFDAEDCTQNDKLVLMLEKIELSRGFVNIQKKNSQTHNVNFCLLPSKIRLSTHKLIEEIHTEGDVIYEKNKESMRYMSPDSRLQTQSDSRYGTLNPNMTLTTTRSKTPQGLNNFSQSSIFRTMDDRMTTTNKIFDRYYEFLSKIFRSYCTFSGGNNEYKMKTIKLIKLLRESGLVKEFDAGAADMQPSVKSLQKLLTDRNDIQSIKQFIAKSCRQIDIRTIDLYLAKMLNTRSSSNLQKSPSNRSVDWGSPSRGDGQGGKDEIGKYHQQTKLEYDQFLRTLNFVAKKVYPELEDDIGIQYLIEKHLYKAFQQSEKLPKQNDKNVDTRFHLQKLMQILKDEAVVDILGRIKKAFHSYFNYYSNNEEYLGFNEFQKFCKDFEIFPQVLSRTRLLALFHNLASLQPLLYKENDPDGQQYSYMNNNVPEGTQSTIDENLFVEAIALIASEIEDNISAHIVEKICYLLEKMNSATGPKAIEKALRNSFSKSFDHVKSIGDILRYIKNKYTTLTNVQKKPVQITKKPTFEQLFPKRLGNNP